MTLMRFNNAKRVHSMTGAELNCVFVWVHVTWLERRRVREEERELCELGVATSIAVISEIHVKFLGVLYWFVCSRA